MQSKYRLSRETQKGFVCKIKHEKVQHRHEVRRSQFQIRCYPLINQGCVYSKRIEKQTMPLTKNRILQLLYIWVENATLTFLRTSRIVVWHYHHRSSRAADTRNCLSSTMAHQYISYANWSIMFGNFLIIMIDCRTMQCKSKTAMTQSKL